MGTPPLERGTIKNLDELAALCDKEYPEIARALKRSSGFVEDLKIIKSFVEKSLETKTAPMVKPLLAYFNTLISISAVVESIEKKPKKVNTPREALEDVLSIPPELLEGLANNWNALLEHVPNTQEKARFLPYVRDFFIGLNGLYYKVPNIAKYPSKVEAARIKWKLKPDEPRFELGTDAKKLEAHYKEILGRAFKNCSTTTEELVRKFAASKRENPSEIARLLRILRLEVGVLRGVGEQLQRATPPSSSLPQLQSEGGVQLTRRGILASFFSALFLMWFTILYLPAIPHMAVANLSAAGRAVVSSARVLAQRLLPRR